MATPRTIAPRPRAIRDMNPLTQYMQARAKTDPYRMGTICCQMKVQLWKLKSRITRMTRRDTPTVIRRSPLMVLALETLPSGVPCARTRASGWAASKSLRVRLMRR